MKKFLLVAVAAFLFAAPAFAQTSIFDLTPEAEAKCTQITREMAFELRLNEPEYIKLKELNRDRLVKTEALLELYNSNAPALNEKMQEIEVAYEQKLASFLTPKQLNAYTNYNHAAVHVKFVATTRN